MPPTETNSPEDTGLLAVIATGDRVAFRRLYALYSGPLFSLALRLLREPGLAALVRDLESGLARGIHALPRSEPSDATLDRIEAQIDARPAPAANTGSSPSPVRWPAFARWGIAALIAVSLSILAVQSLRPAAARPVFILVGLEANQSTYAEFPLQASARDADARFIQLATLAENYWEKPGTTPVSFLAASGGNRGYALFDPGIRQGFIGIEQLPVVGENQRYHLWIVDPATAKVHDAGVLPLAGMSRGLYAFSLAPDDSPKSGRPNFFITVEVDGPAPAPGQPRGKVVLGQPRI